MYVCFPICFLIQALEPLSRDILGRPRSTLDRASFSDGIGMLIGCSKEEAGKIFDALDAGRVRCEDHERHVYL